MLTFVRGEKYSRPDVKESAGLPRTARGGNWDTGIVEHEGEFVIFANIGTEGRTGHDYRNRWEGERLRWYHKRGSHLGWSSVQRLLDRKRNVHVFWRSQNDLPFEYAGTATAIDVADTTPVEVLWSFDTEEAASDSVESPEQLPLRSYREGASRQILVNAHERDRIARQACIAHHGDSCVVCGMRFEERYGALGSGFIHVHHIVPLADVGPDYEVNPVEDLRPVCPNCHAMLHRRRPPLAIDELRGLLR